MAVTLKDVAKRLKSLESKVTDYGLLLDASFAARINLLAKQFGVAIYQLSQ